MKSVIVRVRGRVQGVGFRWFVRDQADARGVHGWVRNLPDGSVEARLQGPPDAVDAVLDALHAGPPAARVDAVDIRPVEQTASRDFRIR